MNYYHVQSDTILSGPHEVQSSYVKQLTQCGNPELLDLASYGLVPEWCEPVDASMGLQPPVLEMREGVLVVAIYAAGTPEEREAVNTQMRRAKMVCTPRQARRALIQAGLFSAVETFVAAGSDDLKVDWEYATEIRRDWPPIAAFASATAISDEQMDALFKQAVTL